MILDHISSELPHLRSRGLFRSAISLSGSSLNWWAHQRHPRGEAVKLAKHTDCDRDTSEQVGPYAYQRQTCFK